MAEVEEIHDVRIVAHANREILRFDVYDEQATGMHVLYPRKLSPIDPIRQPASSRWTVQLTICWASMHTVRRENLCLQNLNRDPKFGPSFSKTRM